MAVIDASCDSTSKETPQLYRREPVETRRDHVWVAPFSAEDQRLRLRDNLKHLVGR
jgi:hypothetical protein